MFIPTRLNRKQALPFAKANKNEALKNYFASLKIREEIGDKAGVAASYGSIGLIFTMQQNYREAEEFFAKAIKLSKEMGNKELLKITYLGLTDLYNATGDFKNAFKNHKIFILYRDSLDNEETRKKTVQGQMNFDFEKKEAVAGAEHKKELENQQAIAETKNTQHKIVIAFVAGGLLLVLIFAGYILRTLSVTRKQKQLIETQKLAVENQKKIVEEHQKEIIDSIRYAKRIQHALLPTEKYVAKNLNRLMKL